jgi:hypothetical protein
MPGLIERPVLAVLEIEENRSPLWRSGRAFECPAPGQPRSVAGKHRRGRKTAFGLRGRSAQVVQERRLRCSEGPMCFVCSVLSWAIGKHELKHPTAHAVGSPRRSHIALTPTLSHRNGSDRRPSPCALSHRNGRGGKTAAARTRQLTLSARRVASRFALTLRPLPSEWERQTALSLRPLPSVGSDRRPSPCALSHRNGSDRRPSPCALSHRNGRGDEDACVTAARPVSLSVSPACRCGGL